MARLARHTQNYVSSAWMVFAIAASTLSLFGAMPAWATPIYSTTLDQTGSSGQGSGPFATVSLSDEANGTTVDVTVALLAAATGFVTTGTHEAFSFSLPEAITITNLTAGFSIGPTDSSNPPAGTFDYSIVCTVCGNGASNPYTGDLTFSVAASTAITPLSFTTSSGGALFAADILANGSTGAVYTDTALSVTGDTTVPEPAGLAILATALAALVTIRARRRRGVDVAA